MIRKLIIRQWLLVRFETFSNVTQPRLAVAAYKARGEGSAEMRLDAEAAW